MANYMYWERLCVWTLLAVVITGGLLLEGVDGIASGCVNSDHCICTKPNVVLCKCKPGGHLNLLTFMIPKHLETLEINGCDAVAFNPMTFSETYPKVLRVVNVKELFVRALAFHNVHGMSEILIKDTTIANLVPHAFTNVTKLLALRFDTVVISNVSSLAFNDVGDIEELSFVGCTIDAMDTDAFNRTRNVATVRVANSTIRILKSDAASFVNVGRFHMTSTSVQNLMTRSLTVDSALDVAFDDCHLGVLQSHAIVTNNVTNGVRLTKCRFDHLLADSLKGLQQENDVTAVGNVTFTENYLKIADDGAWTNFFNRSSSFLKFVDNDFTCDSNLCWLLVRGHQTSLDTFLADNRCSADNATLSVFASTIDDEDVCGQADQSSGHSQTSDSALASTSSQTPTTAKGDDVAAASSSADNLKTIGLVGVVLSVGSLLASV